ncbi:MAG: FtsH protease activity modulator HflK [Dongiaceae bacterium]
MPWQNQGGGGGPWGGGSGSGGGGQGPWGRGPSSGGQGGPPDLEEMLRRGQDRMKQFIPGGLGGGRMAAAIAGGLLIIWGLSGFYQVQPDEVGVPLVFGKAHAVTTPGLHWNWPTPIGSVERPKVTQVSTVEIGGAGGSEESLILTGDENIIDIRFTVQWLINDPRLFLFNIREPDETIRSVAQSAMREIIGQTPFEFARSDAGRGQIVTRTTDLIQRTLDSYGAGIAVTQVALRNTDPPAAVNEAFQDVAAAIQDAQRLRNEADRYRFEVGNRVQGEAQQTVLQAEAYKAERIASATGEAQRFLAQYEQFRAAPDITKRRLYLETMERIMGKLDKVLIDEGAGGSVPYLSLNELMRRLEQPAAPRNSTEPATQPAGASQ